MSGAGIMEISALIASKGSESSAAQKTQPQMGNDFAQTLHAAKAPPGPEPPPGGGSKTQEVEQKTSEPNAQSKKPDPLSKDQEPQPQANQVALVIPAVAVKVEVPLVKGASAQLGDSTPKSDARAVLADKVLLSAETLPSDKSTKIGKIATLQNRQPPAQEAAKILEATSAKPAPAAETPAPAKIDEKAKIETQGTQKAAGPDKSTAASQKAIPEKAADNQQTLYAESAAPSTDPQFGGKPGSEEKPGHQNSDTKQTPSLDKVSVANGTDKSANVLQANTQQKSARSDQAPESNKIEAPRPVPNLRVMREMSDRMDMLSTARKIGSVTVNLDHDDLGPLTMVVHSARGKVDAQFMTESSSIRAALNQTRSDLNQALDSKGLSLGQMSVGDRHGQPNREQPNQGNQRFLARQEAAGGASLQHRGTSAQGVDLWI